MDGAFERLYAGDGRPPVPPEPLLLANRTKKGRRITAGAGKGYDVQADVNADVRALRAISVTPHIAGF